MWPSDKNVWRPLPQRTKKNANTQTKDMEKQQQRQQQQHQKQQPIILNEARQQAAM